MVVKERLPPWQVNQIRIARKIGFHTGSKQMIRAVRIFSVLVGLIANLIPLYGVLYWQWDAFQLLMLYWTETVIVAFWTILGITRVPVDQLGTITVGGRPRPATHKLLCGYFTLVASLFILGHLAFLWIMFSGEWLKKVSGSSSILKELYVTDGLWLALIFMFVSGWISYLTSPPPVVPQPRRRDATQTLGKDTVANTSEEGSDAVGEVVGGLFVRITVMQIAIIVGGMLAKAYGSMAPLLIVIGCKTLIDAGTTSRGSQPSRA
jgi:hypothetical protein